MKRWLGRLIPAGVLLAVLVVAGAPSATAATSNGYTAAQLWTASKVSPVYGDGVGTDPTGDWEGGYTVYVPPSTEGATQYGGFGMLLSDVYAYNSGQFRVDYTLFGLAEAKPHYLRMTRQIFCSATANGVGESDVTVQWDGYYAGSWPRASEVEYMTFTCPSGRPYFIGMLFTYYPAKGYASPPTGNRLFWANNVIEAPRPMGDFCTLYASGTWPFSLGDLCSFTGGGGVGGDFGGVDEHSAEEYAAAGTYAGACPDPPSASWSDWSWLPDWIGYHARCLFVPLGMPMDPVIEAVKGTFAGDIAEMVAGLSGVSVSPGCGVLGSAATPLGGSLTIDTCTWATGVTAARDVLGVALIMGTVVFVAGRLLSILGLAWFRSDPGDEAALR